MCVQRSLLLSTLTPSSLFKVLSTFNKREHAVFDRYLSRSRLKPNSPKATATLSVSQSRSCLSSCKSDHWSQSRPIQHFVMKLRQTSNGWHSCCHIKDFLGSNLEQDTGKPDKGISCFFSVVWDKWGQITSNYAMHVTFYIIPN